MCELLGICFNLTVDPRVSFSGFRQRSKKNPDGWGLAFYPDETAQVIKEPIKGTESPLSDFLKDYSISAKIFLAHVRIASSGNVAYRNTHPFERELSGRDYVFVHNGTLRNVENLTLGQFRPMGQTDSEHAFCHLLNRIGERGIIDWSSEDFDWLHEQLIEVNDLGRFNCIFSNGQHLFCYHDMNGYSGLCFVHRRPPYSHIRLVDNDWVINLGAEKRREQTGYVVATQELTDESWNTFERGELMVFSQGQILHSSNELA